MIDFMRLNDIPVRVTSLRRVDLDGPDGAPRAGFEVVVLLRSRQADEEFAALLARGTLRLDLPAEGGPDLRWVDPVAVTRDVVGEGERAAYRYQVTLRERRGGDPAPDGDPIGRLRAYLEALVETLEGAGVVPPGTVEAAYRRRLAGETERPPLPSPGEGVER